MVAINTNLNTNITFNILPVIDIRNHFKQFTTTREIVSHHFEFRSKTKTKSTVKKWQRHCEKGARLN